MIAAARFWYFVFRIALAERLAYRGDFALATLARFLPIVTQIFLWQAVFEAVGAEQAASGGGGPGGETTLVGYRFPEMVAYYLLTMVARAFSSMPGLASGVAGQIRSGEIKRYLVQPIDPVGFLLAGRVAHKVAYYAVATGPFALVFFLCRDYFVDGRPDAPTLAAFVASLLMAFVLGFFLETALGLAAFWFLEISSLLFIYMLLSFFLSGHMFPLDMLPEPWRTAVDLLPLHYLAYFPAAVFLGKVEGAALARGLAMETAWIVGLMFLCRYLWRAGTHRYAGYGG